MGYLEYYHEKAWAYFDFLVLTNNISILTAN